MITSPAKLSRAVWGFIIGDALGVPAEFCSRAELQRSPITGMTGYGTHSQPPGTWSDDSSMMLCTLENIREGGSMETLANKFLAWYRDAYMTPHGEVFDIGITTRAALMKLQAGIPHTASGVSEERVACGNGTLMRVLPFAFSTAYAATDTSARFAMVSAAGAITHAHALPHLCSFFYAELLHQLSNDLPAADALAITRHTVESIIAAMPGTDTAAMSDTTAAVIPDTATAEIPDSATSEMADTTVAPMPDKTAAAIPDTAFAHRMASILDRILHADFTTIDISEIRSGGYVVHTLEAVLWSWLNGTDYRSITLQAVNLGDDTDTVAALAGALAGITHGPDKEWMETIVAADRIHALLK
ncbi:ADP-ribosylglycohydrolase family protein [Flavihumibacter sediminis]|nr:ADP-ribosylglycohydrolase family protein [Flavihumibacter sediminis]